jgi:hypothetical protein
MISLVLMSGSIFCHAVPVDAGLFTTYTNDNAKTTLYWIVCGSIPPGSGCYSFGQVGPFGEIGAARDQNLAIWQKSGGAEVAARVGAGCVCPGALGWIVQLAGGETGGTSNGQHRPGFQPNGGMARTSRVEIACSGPAVRRWIVEFADGCVRAAVARRTAARHQHLSILEQGGGMSKASQDREPAEDHAPVVGSYSSAAANTVPLAPRPPEIKTFLLVRTTAGNTCLLERYSRSGPLARG